MNDEGMAFKRSAVRSRISPPKKRYPKGYLFFCILILRIFPEKVRMDKEKQG